VRVATWNVSKNNAAEQVLNHLRAAPWELVCLQEVSASTSGLLAQEPSWELVDGLRLAAEHLSGKRPNASAIVARGGWRLEDGAVMADTHAAGKGVTAHASCDGLELTVVSWHAPHAQRWKGDTKAKAIARKMRGYEVLGRLIAGIAGPVVVGMDSNHWNLRTKLALPDPPAEDRPHYVEDRFFSSDADHRLRDALISYLGEHPERHAELVKLRPDGPLEITHDRGGSGTLDRFDYLMISDEFKVEEITHEYDEDEGGVGGSDHGFVSAELSLIA
jgi:hypothetical protein